VSPFHVGLLKENELTKPISWQVMSTVDNQPNYANLWAAGSVDTLARTLARDSFRDETHICIILEGISPQSSSTTLITHEHLIKLRIRTMVDPTPVLTALNTANLRAIEMVIAYPSAHNAAIESALEIVFEKNPSLVQISATGPGGSILGPTFLQKIIRREVAMAN
jgi:hypothetical protein